MNSTWAFQDAIFLEDFDIKGLSVLIPNCEVGVRVNAIYAQIARYSGNPKRYVELILCQNAIRKVATDKTRQYKYTTMELKDVIKCFGEDLNKMPKSSFISSKAFLEMVPQSYTL